MAACRARRVRGRQGRANPAGGEPDRKVGRVRTEAVRALAKLTVSLRITGVLDDGYHLIDAEMVTVDLADELHVPSGGDGLEVVAAASGLSGSPGGDDNLVRQALAAVGRTARGAAGQAHPGRRGPGRRVGRLGLPCCAGAGSRRRPCWLPAWEPTWPFCVAGAGGPV